MKSNLSNIKKSLKDCADNIELFEESLQDSSDRHETFEVKPEVVQAIRAITIIDRAHLSNIKQYLEVCEYNLETFEKSLKIRYQNIKTHRRWNLFFIILAYVVGVTHGAGLI